MKRLVLDASGIRGTSRHAFEACRGQYEFFADRDLLCELFTHCEKKKAFSKEQAALKTVEYLNKISCLTKLKGDPVRFELENGISAREYLMKVPSDPYYPSDADIKSIRERERLMAKVFNFKHPPECDAAFQELQQTKGNKRWPLITEILNNVAFINYVQEESVTDGWEFGNRQRWKVSNNFCPDREWLTFGTTLSRNCYMYWKFAWHGDNVPEPDIQVNSSYDMIHVAHVAICDGLLSNDTTMLNSAWACWPEKRDGLMTYDHDKKAIVPYEPRWQKS